MELELSTSHHGDRAVVTVGGEVDLETASQLGDAAVEAVQGVSPHLVLDLSGVTFMDSTGLKVLLTSQRRAQLAGGSFALAGASRTVQRILALTGLDQSIPAFPTVDEALAARLEGPPPAVDPPA